MEFKGVNDLRESFLQFFEEKGHTRLPSFSLVPKDDNSLLLINSGMAPMKKYFMGELPPPSNRITTCQKCIRNNDIENVGYTSRHLTYFEMLGNFSFGDYFKEKAIPWAWEYFTETLQVPPELLYISVYLDDDDAYDIWTKKIGIPEERMVRLGKEDNFWEHGVGPCGPCSELYFDRGEENGCHKPGCAPGCDCDRFVEVGNIVFTQFDSDGKGNYTPLEHPNIDFGMGLERLACVIQGVENVFMIDTMQKILGHIEGLAGVKHGDDPKKDVSLKVITDHIRSVTFMVGDGVLGSNEGRGYVLRRLIRRAARHGRLLGINKAFLFEIADTVIRENKSAYPELEEKRETIIKIIQNEEESFGRTIDQGLAIINRLIDSAEGKIFSGENAFLLNDTYGFPLDLTKEILEERNLSVDEARFEELMKIQRERARTARKSAAKDAWAGEGNATDGLPATVFTGYQHMNGMAKVIALIQDGKQVDNASSGAQISVVMDTTPFYAVSGGQVADTGELLFDGGKVRVEDVSKDGQGVYLHRGFVEGGSIKKGMTVDTEVNRRNRLAIMRNHTAAHLLQSALKKVLGEHVEQAGQLVDEKRMRFDFTHFSALSPQEIMKVEELVNSSIFDATDVEVREMPIEEAKQIGAIALFGEKYGDTVRVVSFGDVSRELCGGTHVHNTANLGLFKIISESSVASGVRRIEAITGTNVLELINSYEDIFHRTVTAIKLQNIHDLPARIGQLMSDLQERGRLLDKLQSQLASKSADGLFENAEDVQGVKVISAFMKGVDIEELKTMADKARNHDEAVAVLLAGENNGSIGLVAAANKQAQAKGIKAGVLVKEVAVLAGGNGGGRPDFAMAGVKDRAKLEEAMKQVNNIVGKFIS